MTSLTTYINYKNHLPADIDGLPTRDFSIIQDGTAKTFSQELRASLKLDRWAVVVGGNYEHDRVSDYDPLDITDSAVSYAFQDFYGTRWNTAAYLSNQRFNTYAVFGNVEFKVTPALTVQGGVRYTQSENSFVGCTTDTGDGNGAAAYTPLINGIRATAGLSPITLQPGQCMTIDQTTLNPGLVRTNLNQDNVSWRAGLQYKLDRSVLLYANVSKGYKAGGYQQLSATSSSALDPAVQESVLAYEAGVKAGLWNNRLQLNAAGFYYDYKDKQVTGTKIDPAVGPESVLVNIPKSRVYGAEVQVTIAPFRGLTLNGAGSYIRSKITGDYFGVNSLGNNQNFRGTEIPYVPHWQLNGQARYEWSLTNDLNMFGSVSGQYQSRSNASLGGVPGFEIKAYALADLSAGVETPGGKWRAYIWGRNVTNTNYWVSVQRDLSSRTRYMGRPASYGATLEFHY